MPKESIHTHIDPKVYKEVRKFCDRKGYKIQAIIERALIELLNREGRYETPIRPK